MLTRSRGRSRLGGSAWEHSSPPSLLLVADEVDEGAERLSVIFEGVNCAAEALKTERGLGLVRPDVRGVVVHLPCVDARQRGMSIRCCVLAAEKCTPMLWRHLGRVGIPEQRKRVGCGFEEVVIRLLHAQQISLNRRQLSECVREKVEQRLQVRGGSLEICLLGLECCVSVLNENDRCTREYRCDRSDGLNPAGPFGLRHAQRPPIHEEEAELRCSSSHVLILQFLNRIVLEVAT